jgi:RNA polymerase sigma-70 factor (ECF subfamily)
LASDRHIKEKEFEEMLRNMDSIIYRICFAFTNRQPDNVDDLYQEITCKLWKGWLGYRGECDLKTWVYRIAYNTAVDDYRARHATDSQRFVPFDDDLSDNLTDEVHEEQVDTLYRLIDRLSDKDKEIVFLYLDQVPEKEIARVIGKSVPAVKQSIYRIKNKLKKQYEKERNKK